MRNLPTCNGCERRSDLISAWGQLWCPDCLAREGKAAAGISDERIWPETQELCDQIERECRENFLNHKTLTAPRSSAYIDRDNEVNRVPEGGYISEYHSEQMNAWLTL